MRQLLENDLGHGASGKHVDAQIALGQISVEDRQLLPDRLVQRQFGRQLRLQLRGRAWAQHDLHGVAGNCADHQKHGGDRHDQDQERQSEPTDCVE
jgi:hypothetical protein